MRVKRDGNKVWVHRASCVHKRKLKTAPKPAPTPQPTPKISYQAAVDLSFTRAASDPLLVTYDYSADATETVNGQTLTLGAEGQLPSGVLNFYSATTPGGPEPLYCSMNVADATTGGACPVAVSTTGTFSVTTQYIPTGGHR